MGGAGLDEKSLARIRFIERTNLLLLALALAASLLMRSAAFTAGIAVGGVIVAVNFRWLMKIVEKALFSEGKTKASMALNLLLKIVFTFGGLAALLLYTGIDRLAVVAGTSTIIVSIMIHGIADFWKED
jgi:hypothetical protein